MKKKILVLAVLVICLAIAATGTLAYFTTTGTARNVITSGKIKIAVVEQMLDGDNLVDFPEEGLTGIMPGSTVSKIVRVKNDNGQDAWVRVLLDVTITASDDTELPTELSNDEDVIMFEIGSDWAAKDGYFYYTKPITNNELTTPLFETLTFNTKMGNEYQNCTANVVVYVEAVQKDNNGATYLEAAGWPES